MQEVSRQEELLETLVHEVSSLKAELLDTELPEKLVQEALSLKAELVEKLVQGVLSLKAELLDTELLEKLVQEVSSINAKVKRTNANVKRINANVKLIAHRSRGYIVFHPWAFISGFLSTVILAQYHPLLYRYLNVFAPIKRMLRTVS